MVTNKLYLDDRNNDYIVLCKLGSHTISGCRVTGVGPLKPPRSWEAKKEPDLNRVKRESSSKMATEWLEWEAQNRGICIRH